MIIYTCPSNINFTPPPHGNHQARLTDIRWTCTCDGFRYGYTCVHIKKGMELACGKYSEALVLGIGPTEPGRCECGEQLVPIESYDVLEDEPIVKGQIYF